MNADDILVCYQAGEGILGLARLASEGYRHPVKQYATFDLKPRPRVWFANPLECAELRCLPNARQEIEFLKMHTGTIFRMTRPGLEIVLSFLLAKNPGQRENVEKFFAA